MKRSKKAALVFGGSGMLSGVSEYLAEAGFATGVIGRSQNRLDRLCKNNKRLIPLSLDYHDLAKLKEQIQQFHSQYHNIEKVVAWIHGNDVPVINTLNALMDVSEKPWHLYHVLGSASDKQAIERRLKPSASCTYRQVQLGFVREDGYSRWLSHPEIVAATIEAIEKDKDLVIGQIDPWSQRP